MKTGYRRKFPAVRRTGFLRRDSCGEIRCLTGAIWRKTVLHGGLTESGICAESMTYCASTISGALIRIMRYPTEERTQEREDGEKDRGRYLCRVYDVLRIDHFRGFDSYYAIPYGRTDAREGRWRKGPGIALFSALEEKAGRQPVIAEDLGFLTDSVRTLLRESGFPGMKVLEFAFASLLSLRIWDF